MPINGGKEKEDVVPMYKGKVAIESTKTPSFAEMRIDLEGAIRNEVRKPFLRGDPQYLQST